MKFYLLVIVAIAFLAYVSSESCVQCTSATDTRCATDPMSFLSKECQNSTSKCFTRVLNGVTIRGCATDLDNATTATCNNELECLICSFMEGCNRQIFPLHRAQCLQCTGNSTNSTCATNNYLKPTVCPIYKLGDKCFIRNTGVEGKNGSFTRGCESSAVAAKVCIKEGNCFTCEGQGCNFLAPNNTLIPIARDGGAITTMISALLLIASVFVSGYAL